MTVTLTEEELYEEASNWAVVTDDDDDVSPTERYGIWMAVIVFIGFIICSGCMTALIIYCSRAQERSKANGLQAKRDKRHDSMKKNLTCKPWSPDDPTVSTRTEMETCSDTSSDRSSNVTASDVEEALPRPADANPKLKHKDGSHCPLCNKEYRPGQPVYQSNNPKCGHVCHKACMDKWLQFQNTCPTCNNPFMIEPSLQCNGITDSV